MSVLPDWHDPHDGTELSDESGVLVSQSGRTYPVVDGIPRFMSSRNYAGAFGEQWKRYRRTQLDSHTGLPISRVRLKRCLGPAIWDGLAGKLVLEAGCGAGRFTEVLLDKGALVMSIDLSMAVEANRSNFPENDFHRIAQADITLLPFAPQQFDLVLCLGVIQHTPSPERTIASLYAQVRPGGSLVIDQYTHTLSYYTKVTSLLLRPILKRLPDKMGIHVVELLTRLLHPVHRIGKISYPLQALLSRIAPVISYYHVYPELSDQLQRELSYLDTHDSLTDWYKHLRSRDRTRRTLADVGVEQIWCEYGGNGVEARGTRPRDPDKLKQSV